MNKKCWILILVVYLAVLFKITVFRSDFGENRLFVNGTLELVPIVNLVDLFLHESPPFFVYLFAGNIVWFVPLGFLLRRLTKLPVHKIVLAGFAVSMLIEMLQFVFGTGVSDVDDLILNTTGTLIGAYMRGIHSDYSENS